MFYDPTMKLIEDKRVVKDRRFLVAADEIRKRGWCQGEGCNAFGNVCLEYAVSIADRFGFDEMLQTVVRRVKMSAYYWNDQPGRTKEEVIAVLEELAYE